MLKAELNEILGRKGWVTGQDVKSYSRDWLDRDDVLPLGVARPKTTIEVAAVVLVCHQAGVSVVPQGGNTGLCGGAVLAHGPGIILSLSRMNMIGIPDPDSGAIEVEAGAVLANIHTALAPHGLMFPMQLGAEGTAQVGGLIGTNAGGSHAARYGMMQDLVLGLEVVLHDGTIWNGLRTVQKDNAGYQLRKLFCGAEGTLGIVTRAILRLFPAPKQRQTALLAVPDMTALVETGTELKAEAAEFLSGFEFFSDMGLDLALRHIKELVFPLENRTPWYLLVELSAGSHRVPLLEILQDALERGFEKGQLVDGTIAMSESQRSGIWRVREEQPEGQRIEGEQLKHDISVPPGRLVQFTNEAAQICESILPGVQINAFGHLGDGNVHFNLSPPKGCDGFARRGTEIGLALGRLATELGGSFAAEHGLGRSKVALADALRSSVERDMLDRIKHALDPSMTFNPGVILAPRSSKPQVRCGKDF